MNIGEYAHCLRRREALFLVSLVGYLLLVSLLVLILHVLYFIVLSVTLRDSSGMVHLTVFIRVKEETGLRIEEL